MESQCLKKYMGHLVFNFQNNQRLKKLYKTKWAKLVMKI